MNRSHLFSAWKWARQCLKLTRQRKLDRRRRFFRPELEVLEGRTLLTAYMVTLATDNNSGGQGQKDPNPNNINSGDLRWCLNQADAGPGNSITFANQVTGKTIDLQAALPDITQSMTIAPAAGVNITVERSNTATTNFRIFTIDAGNTVTLGAFIIQNGLLESDAHDDVGAGIYNQGTLTLDGSIIRSNISDDFGGGIGNTGNLTLKGASINNNQANDGGGIYNTGIVTTAADAPLSTLDTNSANYGAAIYNDGSGNMSLNKVNFTNNIAQQDGGGIYNNSSAGLTIQNSTFKTNKAIAGNGGGILNNGRATINQNTFMDNSAGLEGGAIRNTGNATGNGNTVNGNQVTGIPGALAADETGGGISTDTGDGISFELVNSIVAGNTAPTNPDVDGNFIDDGHNFIGDGTGGDFINGVNGDQVGTTANPLNPMLGPLQDNGGGGLLTELPLAGSPVIDAGDNSYAAATDERGYVRIINNIVDLGAVEYNSYSASSTLSGSISGNASAGTVQFIGTLSGGISGTFSTSYLVINLASGTVSATFSFSGTASNGDSISGSGDFSGSGSINGNSFSGSFSFIGATSDGVLVSGSGTGSGTYDSNFNVSGTFSGSMEAGATSGGTSSSLRPQFASAGAGLYSNDGALTLSASALPNNPVIAPNEIRSVSEAPATPPAVVDADLFGMAQFLSTLDSHSANLESAPLIPASIEGAKTSPLARLLGSNMAGWAGTGQGQRMESLLSSAKRDIDAVEVRSSE